MASHRGLDGFVDAENFLGLSPELETVEFALYELNSSTLGTKSDLIKVKLNLQHRIFLARLLHRGCTGEGVLHAGEEWGFSKRRLQERWNMNTLSLGPAGKCVDYKAPQQARSNNYAHGRFWVEKRRGATQSRLRLGFRIEDARGKHKYQQQVAHLLCTLRHGDSLVGTRRGGYIINYVTHVCGRACCINPYHLEWGTKAEDTMEAASRQHKGNRERWWGYCKKRRWAYYVEGVG